MTLQFGCLYFNIRVFFSSISCVLFSPLFLSLFILLIENLPMERELPTLYVTWKLSERRVVKFLPQRIFKTFFSLEHTHTHTHTHTHFAFPQSPTYGKCNLYLNISIFFSKFLNLKRPSEHSYKGLLNVSLHVRTVICDRELLFRTSSKKLSCPLPLV